MSWFFKWAQAFEDEGFVPDPSGRTFWGSRGSGVLFVRNHPQFGPQLLMIHRSRHVEEPNTWGVPGGAVPKNEEDLFQSALRETTEEIGVLPPHRQVTQYVWQQPGGNFTFTTFILQVLDPNWEPRAFNWEVQDAKWVTLDEATAHNLHFGLRDLLAIMQKKVFSETTRKISQHYLDKNEITLPDEQLGYSPDWGEHHGQVRFVPNYWGAGAKGYYQPPMPLPKKLYHATPYPDKILAEGFRLPKDVGVQSFGGGTEYMSFTSLENARKYQEVLKDLARIANGEYDNMDWKQAFYVLSEKYGGTEPDRLKGLIEMIDGWQKYRAQTDRRHDNARALLDFFGYAHNHGIDVPFIFGSDDKMLDIFKKVRPEQVGILEVETNPMQWHTGTNIWSDTDMSNNYTYNQHENEWRVFDPKGIRPIRRVAQVKNWLTKSIIYGDRTIHN